MLLDYVESAGEHLTDRHLHIIKNKNRDLAILTLLLGTGIRVSRVCRFKSYRCRF